MTPDLAFLSRQYEKYELPREKAYLYKYFKTEVQEAFLKYIHVFGNYTHFSDHTGYHCSLRWLKILHDRLQHLETAHLACKRAFSEESLEKLAVIESGRYKWKNNL